MSELQKVATSTAITVVPTLVYSISVTAAADAASCTLKDVTAGTVYDVIKAPIETTVTRLYQGVQLPKVFLTVTGTAPAVSVEFSR